jgi:hypothetical protein
VQFTAFPSPTMAGFSARSLGRAVRCAAPVALALGLIAADPLFLRYLLPCDCERTLYQLWAPMSALIRAETT